MAIDDDSLAQDVEALMQESAVQDDMNFVDTSKRKLKEGTPGAVLSLLRLSTNAQNENVRLNACKYIIDRQLDINNSGDLDPIDQFMADLEAEFGTVQ